MGLGVARVGGLMSNSWIITLPSGRVLETFSKGNAEKACKMGWKVETALDYLGRVNGEIKKGVVRW